jgi:pyrroloquinoline quinone (PQQ) biosynthesis protein C
MSPSSILAASVAEQTFAEAGIERVRALAEAVGLAPRLPRIEALFRRVLGAWIERPIGAAPPWPSDVGDDHTPYEWSIAFGGADGPELRLLVEPLGSPPSLIANRDRAVAILEQLENEGELDLGRFRAIRDLFLPDDPRGLFSLWLAVSISARGALDYKLYLNPECRGPALAPALVEEALVRLGFSRAWGHVASTIGRRGPVLDEIKYFSLDLAASDRARVKVYARHHHPTIDEMEAAARGAASAVPGDVARFLRQLGAPAGERLSGRALATCLAFVAGGDERPAAATHYYPINGYAEDDAQVAQRVQGMMIENGLDGALYRRALEAFARRPLGERIGLQSYVSFRRQGGSPRVTVYLAPELYRPAAIAQSEPRPAPATSAEIVKRFEDESIADHPFFRRLRREPPNLGALWKLMTNAEIALIREFARNLSQVVARVDDNRVRSILARQLDDELGHGNFAERAHSQLFQKLLAGLAPFRPDGVDVNAIGAPGEKLAAALRDVYFSPDGWEGVGATMLIEIFGKQVDVALGDQFRRQHQIDPTSLEWLHLHEELEQDHAAESLDLAHLAPTAALPSVWRGAERVWLAADTFFHEMYALCW